MLKYKNLFFISQNLNVNVYTSIGMVKMKIDDRILKVRENSFVSALSLQVLIAVDNLTVFRWFAG